MKKTVCWVTGLGLSVLLGACGAADEAGLTDGGDGAEEAPAAGEGAESSARIGLEAPADVAAPPADAMVTASGLASKRLEAGTGTRRPFPSDMVRVHYSGWRPDGTLFDSSLRRSQPLDFALTGVIDGWTEGLQLMVEGEVRRFWIPSELAYGDAPSGGQPAGDLVFDVELLEILGP